MKKLIAIISILTCFTFVFSACNKSNSLLPHVSELRTELYQGEGQNFSLKAGCGFKESPFVNDGKVGKTSNALTFKLMNKETDDATYSLAFNFNQIEYKGVFKLNPITNTVTCDIEVDNFNLKEFTVKISSGAKSEEIVLKSIVPDTAITYATALDYLIKNQSALISHYTDSEGAFNAEIYLRILIKDNAPYWYVGIASGNEKLKALLIDGTNGEILAIREIF